MRALSRPGFTGWGLALTVLAVTGWGAVVLPDRQLISWFTDDSFYYLEVARHVAAGSGFTFDGVHATNGFQPLWLFLLVPVFKAFPGDFLSLRVVILLQSALLSGAVLLFWRTLRPRLGAAASAATSLLLIGMPGASFLWLGMESALFLLLLVLTWRAWMALEAREEPGVGDCFKLGSCCALLFLARLEGAFALCAAALLGARGFRRRGRRATLLTAFLLPPALVAIIYLVWNWYSFGLWLPISGMIKAQWFATLSLPQKLLGIVDIPWIGRNLLERLYGTPMLPDGARLLCGAVFLAAVGFAWRRRTRLAPLLHDTGTAFIVLCCGGVMAADQALVGPFLGDWAMVPVHVLTAVVLGVAVFRFPIARRAAVVTALALCLLRIPVQAWRASDWRNSFMGQSLILAEWVSANVPAEERLGSLFSGVLSYFGHRTVVSLDGLVNDRDFYRQVVVGGRWDAYLEATHVKWLADVGCGDDPPLAILRHTSRGGFRTSRCYALAHRVDEPQRRWACDFLLWKKIQDVCEPDAQGSPG